jgi:hypothetical protein
MRKSEIIQAHTILFTVNWRCGAPCMGGNSVEKESLAAISSVSTLSCKDQGQRENFSWNTLNMLYSSWCEDAE